MTAEVTSDIVFRTIVVFEADRGRTLSTTDAKRIAIDHLKRTMPNSWHLWTVSYIAPVFSRKVRVSFTAKHVTRKEGRY
jgi:hypothetical protein